MEKCGKTDVLDPETGRPLCKLHGEPMCWHKDSRHSLGGILECKIRKQAQLQEWRTKNPKKMHEYSKLAWVRHREKKALSAREWRSRNPEKVYLYGVDIVLKRKRQRLEEAGSVGSES